MATEQLDKGTGDNLDARLASFGIQPLGDTEPQEVVRDESESETEIVTESDESETADASVETSEETDESVDEEGDDGEQEGGGDESRRTESLQTDLDKAVADSRAWQSRFDQESAKNQNFQEQMQNFHSELQTLKQQNATESVDIADDELVDGRMVKAFVKAQQQPVQPQTQPSNASKSDKNVQAAWLNGRSDLTEVSQYITDNSLQSDPTINGLPTDKVGYYHAVKSMMLEGQIKAMEKNHKADLDKALAGQKKKLAKKSKVTPTGGEGAGANRGDSLSQTESEFMAFGKKFGMTMGS